MNRLEKYAPPIRQLIRQFLDEAYQRELHQALSQLDIHFNEWCDGELYNEQLIEHIYQFQDNELRKIKERYFGEYPDLLLAYAFTKGIFETHEVPLELIETLSPLIEMIETVQKIRK